MAPNTDIATRGLVVGLKSIGGLSSAEISIKTGLTINTINRIFGRACSRRSPYKMYVSGLQVYIAFALTRRTPFLQ